MLIECQRAGVAFSGRAAWMYEDDSDGLDVDEIADTEDDEQDHDGEDPDQHEIREIESRRGLMPVRIPLRVRCQVGVGTVFET